MFSSDLSSMIASLLKVNPKQRPSTEQILQMPVFIAKYNESGQYGEENKELIGTIKVPKNLSLLANVLPESQYEQELPASPVMVNALSGQLPQISEGIEDDYVPMIAANRRNNNNASVNVHKRKGVPLQARMNDARRPSASQDPHLRYMSNGPNDEP